MMQLLVGSVLHRRRSQADVPQSASLPLSPAEALEPQSTSWPASPAESLAAQSTSWPSSPAESLAAQSASWPSSPADAFAADATTALEHAVRGRRSRRSVEEAETDESAHSMSHHEIRRMSMAEFLVESRSQSRSGSMEPAEIGHSDVEDGSTTDLRHASPHVAEADMQPEVDLAAAGSKLDLDASTTEPSAEVGEGGDQALAAVSGKKKRERFVESKFAAFQESMVGAFDRHCIDIRRQLEGRDKQREVAAIATNLKAAFERHRIDTRQQSERRETELRELIQRLESHQNGKMSMLCDALAKLDQKNASSDGRVELCEKSFAILHDDLSGAFAAMQSANSDVRQRMEVMERRVGALHVAEVAAADLKTRVGPAMAMPSGWGFPCTITNPCTIEHRGYSEQRHRDAQEEVSMLAATCEELKRAVSLWDERFASLHSFGAGGSQCERSQRMDATTSQIVTPQRMDVSAVAWDPNAFASAIASYRMEMQEQIEQRLGESDDNLATLSDTVEYLDQKDTILSEKLEALSKTGATAEERIAKLFEIIEGLNKYMTLCQAKATLQDADIAALAADLKAFAHDAQIQRIEIREQIETRHSDSEGRISILSETPEDLKTKAALSDEVAGLSTEFKEIVDAFENHRNEIRELIQHEQQNNYHRSGHGVQLEWLQRTEAMEIKFARLQEAMEAKMILQDMEVATAAAVAADLKTWTNEVDSRHSEMRNHMEKRHSNSEEKLSMLSQTLSMQSQTLEGLNEKVVILWSCLHGQQQQISDMMLDALRTGLEDGALSRSGTDFALEPSGRAENVHSETATFQEAEVAAMAADVKACASAVASHRIDIQEKIEQQHSESEEKISVLSAMFESLHKKMELSEAGAHSVAELRLELSEAKTVARDAQVTRLAAGLKACSSAGSHHSQMQNEIEPRSSDSTETVSSLSEKQVALFVEALEALHDSTWDILQRTAVMETKVTTLQDVDVAALVADLTSVAGAFASHRTEVLEQLERRDRDSMGKAEVAEIAMDLKACERALESHRIEMRDQAEEQQMALEQRLSKIALCEALAALHVGLDASVDSRAVEDPCVAAQEAEGAASAADLKTSASPFAGLRIEIGEQLRSDSD